MNWISVEDELPSLKNVVLLWCEHVDYSPNWYSGILLANGEWEIDCPSHIKRNIEGVTHWMEIQAPEESE